MSIDESIKIVTFGPGYGESIVLFIPKIGWGVVDSCKYKIGKEKHNPSLDFLISNKVERLSFVILTHPHEDHYDGLDEIVEAFLGRIDRIAYYSGSGLREYRRYLAVNDLLGNPGLRNLGRVFESFKKARDNGARGRVISENTIIVSNNEVDNIVKIMALSPSAKSIEKYQEILHRSLPKENGDFLQYVNDREHNLISAAIYIRVGNATIILGSDVEIGNDSSMGWKAILDNEDLPNIACHVVKVPHHGSETGFCHELWRIFAQNASLHLSIVTPYNRGKNPLPQADLLNEIQNYSKLIAISSKVIFKKPKHVYSRTVTNNLKGVKSWKCISEPDNIGSIAIEISPSTGEVIKTDIQPPAFFYDKVS